MIRTFFLALSTAAIFAGIAQAQVAPDFPRLPPPGAGLKEIEEFQRQFERAIQLQRFEMQQAFGQRRGAERINDGSISWGGARLTKADAKLRQQLGLDDAEGLVVSAVEPRSPAEKAGLKGNDVLVKIADKSVPHDLDGFTKLLKDQKVDNATDLVVVRNGKEETLKGAKMPAVAQANIGGSRPLAGGRQVLPAMPLKLGFGRVVIPQVQVDKLHLEMSVNGAKIIRRQEGTQFSGEYTKDNLKVTLEGKIENGRPEPGAITVSEGKETKKFASPRDVPGQYHAIIQQLMPSGPLGGMMLQPALPILEDLPGFPGLPVIPGLDN